MTALLGEALGSGLSLHCGVVIRGMGGDAMRELSSLAWRVRGSRERRESSGASGSGRKQGRKVPGCWHSGRQAAEAPFHTFSLCCSSSMAGLRM